MGKNIILDTFIKKILDNGAKLAIKEILTLARINFSKEYYNEKQIYNFVYNMKKRGEIKQNTEGKYYLSKVSEEKEPVEKNMKKIELDDYKEFEIIDPATHRAVKEVLSVMDTGVIAVNANLLKHFDEFSAEIRLKPDCKELIMIKEGAIKTYFGKIGRTKSYNLIEKLKQANMKFPLYYVGEWDAEREIWHGKYMHYNPNKGKKAEYK